MDFPPNRCTAWEDCQHDGICHDPDGCGAHGPNHDAFYGDDQDDDWDEGAFKCPTCDGTGIANPLSPHLPKDALVLSSTECPRCYGVGEF